MKKESRDNSNQVNENATHLWLKKSSFSSHVEGYISAIQEEEIFTRSLNSKLLTDEHINQNCRLCGNQKETIQQVIASPRYRAMSKSERLDVSTLTTH